MHEAVPDPYCYPGTTILINRLGTRDQAQLAAFEAEMTSDRATEPLPAGRLGYRHYRAIHRHLFQDVYEWAGKIRMVRISKGTSTFCYPEHIDREMRRLFADLTKQGRTLSCRVERHPSIPRGKRSHAVVLPDRAG